MLSNTRDLKRSLALLYPSPKGGIIEPPRTGVPSKHGFGLMGWSSGGSVIGKSKAPQRGSAEKSVLARYHKAMALIVLPIKHKKWNERQMSPLSGLVSSFY